MTAALLASTAAVAGCFGGGAADLRYDPYRRVQPLEDANRAVIFIGRIEDRGGIRLASAEHPTLLLKRPIQVSMREALAVELKRLGFQLADEPGKAGARLTAALSGGEITDQSRHSRNPVGLVRLAIDLSLESRDGRPLWDGQLKGVGDIGAMGSVGSAANAALDDAMSHLGEMLENDRVVAGIVTSGGRP